MKPLQPISTVSLFPEERAALIQLLSQLTVADWDRPTVCTGWSVKDVALHILGGDVGLLSRTPGFKFPGSGDVVEWDDLVAFINQANKIWVEATRRMSTGLLCQLLEFTGGQVYQRLLALDLMALGGPVSWAGPDLAPIWLDVAREYTERWLHQQHIRDAVARPGLTDRHFFAPVLDTFVRALPHTFSQVRRDTGTMVELVILGDAGGTWFLVQTDDAWLLTQEVTSPAQTSLSLDQDIAWRIFTRGISSTEATAQSTLTGDRSLGLKILEAVSIIA
ncbi:MAG TPA: maleylpyruvate isomerase family mycothiol-dependent enzyme [Anaerolineae bacterium]|jgi:uncharacterized protein (TIGR03083 family)